MSNTALYADNPGLRPRLVDDLVTILRNGAFGPDVDTISSRMLMGGTLRITPEVLELAGDKAWLFNFQHEQVVLRQAADEAILARLAEDAQASTGQAPAPARQRARL